MAIFRVRPTGYIYPSGLLGSNAATNTTGGTQTIDGSNAVHIFANSGNFTPSFTGTVEYLAVAGGGAGGIYGISGCCGFYGGGGGAGGLIYGINPVSINRPVIVTVGSGGTTDPAWSSPCSNKYAPRGSNTTICFGRNRIFAHGGGGGGARSTGGPGGSGGGGSLFGAGEAYTWFENGVVQGKNGGGGCQSGGGGGAGTAGTSGYNSACYPTPTRGHGGEGLYFTISGANTAYAGGGGSGRPNPAANPGGKGGYGGGGNTNLPGVVNTGGGGGGGASPGNVGGAGGSGVVIIRYNVGQKHSIN